MIRIAFTRAIQDWWYGLIPLAIMNLMWFGCVVTVVAGPPATAALLVVARDAAVGQGAEFSTFFGALRRSLAALGTLTRSSPSRRSSTCTSGRLSWLRSR